MGKCIEKRGKVTTMPMRIHFCVLQLQVFEKV